MQYLKCSTKLDFLSKIAYNIVLLLKLVPLLIMIIVQKISCSAKDDCELGEIYYAKNSVWNNGFGESEK